MPSRDFKALGEDHRNLLRHVFEAGDCRVFESYSVMNRELAEFKSVKEIEAHYGMTDWINFPDTSMRLALYPNDAGGRISIERIDTPPRRGKPAQFRYSLTGWGMVGLYLVGLRDGWTERSFTNHNSEKRAIAWSSIHPESGPVSDWNWKAVAAFSRRLIRYIDKAAVAKQGAIRILPEAAAFVPPRPVA